MQAAALCFAVPLPAKGIRTLAPRRLLPTGGYRRSTHLPSLAVAAAPENLIVDYSSSTSVFPAEACETIGGDACAVEMFPEVKPPQQAAAAARAGAEEVDREYLDYSERKTLPRRGLRRPWGEFCDPEYQQGVFNETAAAK
ncbi:unnamed protein product [Spirodela intermedia]|uniref:Uncharacterized protein n=1 Tax=Spirodela intermedia TaxID=51605 RepID=A0A7I8J1F9_SPIIN|nr:unnamed protein product [Spirodela intermedia]CAA6663988.1 unnamed protein product [Spirodela intermedia]